MKTAEEKAAEFMNALPLSAAVSRAEILRLTIQLLKEQDRDTRHSCAEAIEMVDSKDMPSDACWKEDACRACMNVKAV